MYSKANVVTRLRHLFSGPHSLVILAGNRVAKTSEFPTSTNYSSICLSEAEGVSEENIDHSNESIELLKEQGCSSSLRFDQNKPAEIFKKWGCTNEDINKLFMRSPALRKADPSQLNHKLNLLNGLGITASDLVKIVNCRPRFLNHRLTHSFDERINFFMCFFASRELLCKAIIRNPSLLTYDLDVKTKPVLALYERLGLSREDLIPMLISRPTLIPRTSFTDEKMDFIRKTGVSKDSKMYKYVASLIGVSRIETIREKVANFEKFGIAEEDVWRLYGQSPLMLTLSVDKVQRNMTYIIGTMKLEASTVLQHPFLIYCNLEAVLKPRVLLSWKIEEMGLEPQIKGKQMLTALRMKEKRFLDIFVRCHPDDVANELMEAFKKAKCIKRLAAASKKIVRRGFPF